MLRGSYMPERTGWNFSTITDAAETKKTVVHKQSKTDLSIAKSKETKIAPEAETVFNQPQIELRRSKRIIIHT